MSALCGVHAPSLSAQVAMMKPSRSEFLDIFGHRHHIRRWGDPDAPLLVFLHGWQDTSATFQFVVDALRQDWSVIAPDWPGYGLSHWHQRQYWMYEDVAILDAVLEHYSADQPVRLVGHSYGGQVATLYAASRPERVSHYINLEGFGPRQQTLADAPANIRGWLDRAKRGMRATTYRDHVALAQRLRATNPRLTADRAEFLARHLGLPQPSGRIQLAIDPWRRIRTFPLSFPAAEFFQTMLRAIGAPALWLHGDDSHYMRDVFPDRQSYQERLQCLRAGNDAVIDNAGHNLQHDQPERVAELIETFLLSAPAKGAPTDGR